ncbi:MAG: hypothetical protein LW878_09630 [Proteobacteria bacterium]|jgi:hypothetical protein|nr:hypothetical protein [Pseudomonadota bacterium]
MSQDDIISKLMDETFEERGKATRLVTNPDSDFNIMTQISRLPVTSLRGHVAADGIYEFAIQGQVLHAPLDHISSKHSASLLGVIAKVLGEDFDRITLVNSAAYVWVFVWSSAEQVEEQDIQKIFSPQRSAKAA